MPLPDLAARNAFFVNYVGTDEPGFNEIGAPWSYRTLDAALAALALVANPPSETNPWIISMGPGVFESADNITLPPWVTISGRDNGQGTIQTTLVFPNQSVILSTAWQENQTALAGLENLKIVSLSGTPMSLGFPVPVAGTPLRRVTIKNVETNGSFAGFGETANDFIEFRNFNDNVPGGGNLSLYSLNAFFAGCRFYSVGLNSSIALGMAVEFSANSFEFVAVNQSGSPLSLKTDVSSMPLRANFGSSGAPVVTLTNDAASLAYSPTTPANWPVQPVTVQEGLDYLAAGGGGGGGTTIVRGTVDLVDAQQNYLIVFPVPFAAPPTSFWAVCSMASNSSAIFLVALDQASLTDAQGEVWLNAVPDVSDVGAKIYWFAIA